MQSFRTGKLKSDKDTRQRIVFFLYLLNETLKLSRFARKGGELNSDED